MRCLHNRNSSKALTFFIAFLCTFFRFCHVFFEMGDTVQKVDEMCTWSLISRKIQICIMAYSSCMIGVF